MSNFYTANMVAKKLGISYSTMISIIKSKKITSTTIGKRKKFTDKDIENYLNKDKTN